MIRQLNTKMTCRPLFFFFFICVREHDAKKQSATCIQLACLCHCVLRQIRLHFHDVYPSPCENARRRATARTSSADRGKRLRAFNDIDLVMFLRLGSSGGHTSCQTSFLVRKKGRILESQGHRPQTRFDRTVEWARRIKFLSRRETTFSLGFVG